MKFICLIIVYVIVRAIINAANNHSPKPQMIAQAEIKRVQPTYVKAEIRRVEPQHFPDMDEIEYQRERLSDLYNILDIIENRLTHATKDTERERLIRKKMTITAQIRRAQKIISKEYAA